MKLTKIALGVALAAGTVAAQADTLFFPNVAASSQVTTLVSVITPVVNGFNSSGAVGGNRLHWIYVGKNSNGGASMNPLTCREVNYYLPHSVNDIQTVDLGEVISNAEDRGVLFNDPGKNNSWRADLDGSLLTYAMAARYRAGAAVTRGYLLVEDVNGPGRVNNLSGYATIFDYGAGAAWGYVAKELATDAPALATQNIQVELWPFAEMVTRFFVTPFANPGMRPTEANFGTLKAEVKMEAFPAAPGTAVAFDRDENAVSGSQPDGMFCIGAADAGNLLSPGAVNVLPYGGWSNFVVNAIAPATSAVVYQLNFGGAGTGTTGTVNGRPMGTFNNGYEVTR